MKAARKPTGFFARQTARGENPVTPGTMVASNRETVRGSAPAQLATMNTNRSAPKLQIKLRTLLVWGLSLLFLGGGSWWSWHFLTTSQSPWVLKWRINRFLKKQTLQGNFRVNFPFPSKAEMSTKVPPPESKDSHLPQVGPQTRKDFDALKKEYIDIRLGMFALEHDIENTEREAARTPAQVAALEKQITDAKTTNAELASVLEARLDSLKSRTSGTGKDVAAKKQALMAKEQALAPVLEDLLVFQRAWAALSDSAPVRDSNALASAQSEFIRGMQQKIQESASYEGIYRHIGEELWVASRLLDSANYNHQRVGLRIARQAGRDALYQAENGWLASSIYRAYVVPHAALSDDRGGLEGVVNECADVFRRADDRNAIYSLYTGLIASAPSPKRADWARVQLAQYHEREGEYADAIRWLKQVQATNDYANVLRRIPWMEQRLKRNR